MNAQYIFISHIRYLDEIKYFINKMPIKYDVIVWTCLLGTYKIHNKIGHVHSSINN